MTLQLTPATALIVVDLQAATLRTPFAHPADGVVAATASLAAAFHEHGGPVVHAVSTGTPPGRNAYGSEPRLFPEEGRVLAAELPVHDADLRVERARLSVFSGTGLADALHGRGVTTVVVAGVATSFGVESTVREAYDLGFDVVVASDAVTDLRADTHERALEAVFPAIGRVAASADIAAALARARG
ncbi:isochorismatase family protein [Myceligenerans indicum]|uniref:Cysteine hydrolase n=1 Tax=Myceligenerans indicum TaxID=2593663 RepID=A0ABS1LQI1_9MICO|nr:isochorismatase family protein [Myceligenerans indicum]MBL0888546.1 cysteine hydrolase [Myceligenerans indicum]